MLADCYLEDRDSQSGKTTLRTPHLDRPLFDILMTDNPFSHGEMMFRRDAYERVGGYRAFLRFAQDYDLWLRMSRLGEGVVVPEVLYRRQMIPGSVSMDPEKTLLQTLLAEFARQCAASRDAQSRDLLDCLGPTGVLLRRRSPRIANKMAGKGAMLMAGGSRDYGVRFLKAARAEALHPASGCCPS